MRSTPGASRSLTLLVTFVAMSLVSGVLFAGLFIPAVGATGALTSSSVDYFNSLPADLSRPPLAEQSTMYAADGKTVIARFYDENRITVPLSRIAPVMRQAMIAIEDSRFYEHGGIDPKGVMRAFVNNQVGGGVQGASTLTQQYIKNYNVEKCIAAGDEECARRAVAKNEARKLQEMRTAIALEKQLTKDEILEGYLNIALFGDNTFGVEAASEYYFNTSASKLSLVQAATLAGLVQSPSTYSPFAHPDAATTRRNEVLGRMFALKMIDREQYDEARAEKLKTDRHEAQNGCITAGNMAYFCDYVYRTLQLDPAYSYLGKTEAQRRTALKRGGYKIITTLDPKIQNKSASLVTKQVPIKDKSKLAAAAVMVQPGSGKVLAMTQNRVYSLQTKRGETSINYAVDKAYGSSTGFATGSTFKPFTLATWLSKGKSLNDVVNASEPRNGRPFSDFTSCGKRLRGQTYHFSNAEGGGKGAMTVLNATTNSVNTAYVDIESRLDLCDIVDTASKLGVHLASAPTKGSRCSNYSDKNPLVLPNCYPSLTLGPLSISPLTMATAYAAFAADGEFCESRPVAAITSSSGEPQKIAERSCRQAITPEVARGVTYGLKSVLAKGTGSGLGIGRPAAGKTGTADQSSNTWFVGFTPFLSTAVWVADPNTYPGHADTSGQRPLHGITVNGRHYRTIYGATIAGRIWSNIMKNASKGLPAKNWSGPPGSMFKSNGKSIPEVTGLPVSVAMAQLTAMGFQVKNGGMEAGPAPTGVVTRTSPEAGSLAVSGSTVTIYISDGSQGFLPGGDGPGNGNSRGRGRIGTNGEETAAAPG